MEFLLENEIKQVLSKEFLKKEFHQDYEVITIKSPDEKILLEDNSIYFLFSKKIDIPDMAIILMISPDNFFKTTKTKYEDERKFRFEKFRGHYLRVITTSYGIDFIPFNLNFIKITPFDYENK